MDGPAIDPELMAALRRSAELGAALGPPAEGLAGLRAHMKAAEAWWSEGGPQLAETRTVSIPTPRRDVSGILYRPSTASNLPVYVYLHGGGFRFGDAHNDARQLREIAADWGGAVLSLDYSLIPECPFPCAVDEVAAAYAWLARHGGDWGLDGARIAFGGTSAGANISCGAAVALNGVKTGFLRAAALVVPVFSGDSQTGSMLEFGNGPLFPTRAMTVETWADYLGDRSHNADPRANLMRADPTLFPPTFIAAAELDVFRDDAWSMAGRLDHAGVAQSLIIYPGMTHLFFGFGRMVESARRCVADLAAFLKHTLPAST